MSTYLTAIKKAARISHSKLDDEISRLDDYACSELIRAGIPKEQITSDNKLIENAVITRAMMEIGSEKKYQVTRESWEYQLDCLRKHNWEEETESNV